MSNVRIVRGEGATVTAAGLAIAGSVVTTCPSCGQQLTPRELISESRLARVLGTTITVRCRHCRRRHNARAATSH